MHNASQKTQRDRRASRSAAVGGHTRLEALQNAGWGAYVGLKNSKLFTKDTKRKKALTPRGNRLLEIVPTCTSALGAALAKIKTLGAAPSNHPECRGEAVRSRGPPTSGIRQASRPASGPDSRRIQQPPAPTGRRFATASGITALSAVPFHTAEKERYGPPRAGMAGLGEPVGPQGEPREAFTSARARPTTTAHGG